MGAKVTQAEYDEENDVVKYRIEDGTHTVGARFDGRVGEHARLSPEAMQQFADTIEGTEVDGDIHEAFAGALKETSIGMDLRGVHSE